MGPLYSVGNAPLLGNVVMYRDSERNSLISCTSPLLPIGTKERTRNAAGFPPTQRPTDTAQTVPATVQSAGCVQLLHSATCSPIAFRGHTPSASANRVM